MRWVVVLVACGACGRLAFDPLSDAHGDDGRNGDASVDAVPACANWGPFSAPVHAPSLSTTNDEFGTGISADNLAIVFDTDRNGGGTTWDLYEATRSDAASPFGTPTRIQELSTTGSDDNPALSADGLTIYFSSDRLSQSYVWSATRPNRTMSFGAETAVVIPTTPLVAAATPSISADELSIYVSVTRAALDLNIAVAARQTTTEPFGPLVEIPALSTGIMESNPSISADNLELFYQSDAAGTLDMFVSRRATTSDPWPAGQSFANVNTVTYDETDATISYDGTTLWFAIVGAKPGILGGGDLFYATRSCL